MNYICINTGDTYANKCNRVCVHRSGQSPTGCIHHIYKRPLTAQDIAYFRNIDENPKKIIERAEAKIIIAGKILDNINNDKYRRYDFYKAMIAACEAGTLDDTASEILLKPVDHVCIIFRHIDPSLWIDIWNHHRMELKNVGILSDNQDDLMRILYHSRSESNDQESK